MVNTSRYSEFFCMNKRCEQSKFLEIKIQQLFTLFPSLNYTVQHALTDQLVKYNTLFFSDYAQQCLLVTDNLTSINKHSVS